MVPVMCGRTPAELEQRVQGHRRLFADFGAMPLDTLLDALREMFGSTIVGTPDEVISAIQEYADVGVEELIIQWFGMEDVEGLQLLAEQVLPHV
jgi:alkanesulfonate monooxygenase SsuD/methylene tetrahydromethanopterin reductase-like flavin-dependent oxidoreductase (luciferase family)